jgi:hypothetical protein
MDENYLYRQKFVQMDEFIHCIHTPIIYGDFSVIIQPMRRQDIDRYKEP